MAELDEFLAFDAGSSRDRAAWVYERLLSLLNMSSATRTQYLLQFTAEIDAHPRRDEIRTLFHDFWSHHSFVRVISEAGLPDETSLIHELLARAFRYLLPVDEVQGDLYVLLDSLDLREADAQWLSSVPDSIVDWWGDLLRPSSSSIRASCTLLALRATHIALSRDFLRLAEGEDIKNSGFFGLPVLVEHVAQTPADFPQWEQRRNLCESQLREMTESLEQRGSSAGIVYRAGMLRALLFRIHQVLNLQRQESDSRPFAISIVHGFASQRKITSVVSTSMRRLARSVVEKTGRVGSHYIAKNSTQWKAMGWGAMVAGVITAFTALFKYSISSAVQAPVLVAIGHSINYAISFLAMQAGGFLLASKMPAATASTLVDAMEDPEKDHMVSLQSISQTQTLVTIGNLIGALLASFAIDRLWHLLNGHPFLTPEQAEHGVQMLHPLRSLTIPFAIVTGVLLWLSSLATGWTANYCAVTRMGSAIANSVRIRRRIGTAHARRIAHWVEHNAAGSAGYIVLGFLLGCVPIAANLFGIPLEVRHVTLGAASLGFALDALRLQGTLQRADVVTSFAGIALVGLCNIVTSFVFSFLLAIRARDIGKTEARRFLSEVGRKILSHPFTFLLPGFD